MELRGATGVLCTVMALGFGADGRAADDAGTRLLRQPAVSKDHLAFVYGGDIWVSDRDGGRPARITAHPAPEFAPHFSPDGRWIAYSGIYDGNTDVYVVPTAGGQPRRLTWHPSPNVVTGWSPDGKRVLFVSGREVDNARAGQLYEVSVDGGYENKVMKAVAVEGSWSADGKRIAYRPSVMAYAFASGWRQHRGGQTPPIWIIDPKADTLEKIPHVNASDSNPLWVGEDVAFISDRNDGAANLFLYDGHTRSVRQLTHEATWDIRSAGVYDRTIVYEVGGQLKSIDVGSGQVTPIALHLAVQSIQARPQWKDASRTITSARLSPTGKRVLFTARGDIYSVPVKDGSTRNLTATSGIRESDGLWSKDGQHVAYLSDAGGAQALLVRDAAGLEKPVRHALGKMGYFTLLEWSSDTHRIVFQDNHLRIYAIDLASDAVTLVDTSPRRLQFKESFSPDGQWLAYTVVAANNFTQVKLHSFASGTSTELTENFVQTDNPQFSSNGLLYFTASIDAGPSRVGLDMSTQERPLRYGIYAAVLAADGRSPLQPKSGDEESDTANDKLAAVKGDRADKSDKTPRPTRVDLAGLANRFVPIPVPERDYERLLVASDGALLYLSDRQPGVETDPPGSMRDANGDLYRFNFEERTEKLLRSGLIDVSSSRDGKKLLLIEGENKFEVADAGEKLDAKAVDLSGLRAMVDVRQEWQQIFDEVWRMEQQYFYDPNMHGLKWAEIRARYEPLLPFVQRREDLNELLVEMIGEVQVGHNRVGGGDVYAVPGVGTGLLGADYRVESNQYRIQKIYRGDRWNPFLAAPLGAPGIDVAEGDAILAINGRALDGTMNIFSLLEGTAEKQVSLTVSHDGTTKSARTVVVIPVASETALRQWTWVERNREYVDRKSGGKVGYVYLPDTGNEGFTFFNRMFFAQADKGGLIVDDRRNRGGQVANYILETLNRKYLAGWKDRDGLVSSTPGAAIYGPKAMLIDQDAGSGGDFLPYGFKRLGLGKLIGTRTWGGLIGIYANPSLIDGGTLTVPFFRVFTPEGEWHVENEGVAPDVEVPLDPLAVNAGNDPQLDAAIADVVDQLKTAKQIPLKSAPPMPTQPGK